VYTSYGDWIRFAPTVEGLRCIANPERMNSDDATAAITTAPQSHNANKTIFVPGLGATNKRPSVAIILIVEVEMPTSCTSYL